MSSELTTSIVVLHAGMDVADARERLELFPGARWALVQVPARHLWHVIRAAAARHRLGDAPDGARLDGALDLASAETVASFDLRLTPAPYPPGVALAAGEPIGFVPDVHAMSVPGPAAPERGGGGAPVESAATFRADAVVDAPAQVELGEVFDFVVGVREAGAEADLEVTGLTPSEPTVELDLHVVGAFEVMDADAARLVVDRRTLAHEPAVLRLRASVPPFHVDPITGVGVERVEVRFVHRGVPAGRVWREIRIGPAGTAGPSDAPASGGYGVRLGPQPQDVTIVIARPDGDAGSGRFVLTVASPHLEGPGHSWDMPLGRADSAQSLAMRIRGLARAEAATPQTDDTFLGLARFIADRLPEGLWEALAEIDVARGPRGRPMTALLVTDEAYVPWELAAMPVPLDPSRPPFLGAQLSVGRWPQDLPPPAPDPVGGEAIAVVVGRYGTAVGVQPLPGSEAEAADLAARVAARVVPAERATLDDLLEGRSGPVDVLHFTGHGALDEHATDAVALVLADGELNEFAVAAAPIAAGGRVLLVFNACVAGFGHEAMGAYAGMAGAASAAGYRGFLAPIWAVEDGIARTIGVGLYEAAAAGATVGEYLRDVRARFVETAQTAAHTTHLAYAFYGHPDVRIEVPA